MSKEIILKGLCLKNFKGIKDLKIDFGSRTNIYGNNGTGKTTVNDAFTWLLFGKDSHDIAKFNVQPLDSTGSTVHNLDTAVEATLTIDGTVEKLKKVLKEKWVKPKGQPESVLKGTTISYYINDVPQKEKEYKAKIDEIIPENTFKLLTNPLYFSSVMKWQDRRKIIFDMSGDVSQEDVINYNPDLKGLVALLNPDESMEDFNKRIKVKISTLKKDKDNIPARIDECHRNIKELDFKGLEMQKEDLQGQIKTIENKITDSSKVNDELLKKKDKLYQLKDQMKDIWWKNKQAAEKPLENLNKQLQENQKLLQQYQSKLNMAIFNLKETQEEIKFKEARRIALRAKWQQEHNRELEFKDNEFVCPTCHREFEATDIESKKADMLSNFNQEKAKRLEDINTEGKRLKNEIDALGTELDSYKTEDLEKQADDIEKQIASLKKQIADFKPDTDISNNVEYKKLEKQAEQLKAEIEQPNSKEAEIKELRGKKQQLENDLENINTQLRCKVQNEEQEKRIEELTTQQKEVSQQIADLEKAQYLSDKFTRTKVELLEGNINSKFKLVKIKLFENQVNGGLSECCEVMVDGVPFNTSLNSGMRINAGLDIINTLSKHYEVNVPVFTDNAESVTKLIPTESQLIRLIVSENDKKLRIESEDK